MKVERTFRLMDADRDGLLNFKELVQILDAICKGGHETKLKIFYCLHLPGIVLPGLIISLNPLNIRAVDVRSKGSAPSKLKASHILIKPQRF